MFRNSFFLVGSFLLCAGVLACTTQVTGGGAGGTGGDGGSASTSSTSETESSSGSTDSTTSDPTTTGTPTPTGAWGTQVLAVRRLRMGDKTPSGQSAPSAWKGYGLNLDGKTSAADSVDLCKPAAGAKASSVYPDGDNGIDNSFGKNVLPLLLSLSSNFSNEVNQSIDEGRFSMLIQINGIAPGLVGPVVSRGFTAAQNPNQIPAWNGQDVWNIRNESLNGGSLDDPKAYFPSGDILAGGPNQRVWRSGSGGEITLTLSLSNLEIRIPIKQAQLTAVLSDDNKNASSGILAGIIDTEAFIAEFAEAAGAFDPSLCPPSATFESIAQQIRQGQDILLDGSQNPSVSCNGISIGIGFDAEGAVLGSVLPPMTLPDICQ